MVTHPAVDGGGLCETSAGLGCGETVLWNSITRMTLRLTISFILKPKSANQTSGLLPHFSKRQKDDRSQSTDRRRTLNRDLVLGGASETLVFAGVL